MSASLSASSSDDERIPPAALALGLGGVIPFLLPTIAIVVGWRSSLLPPPSLALQAYGAAILSFLGGARWGLALGIKDRRRQAIALAGSVVPSLLAWGALLQPPTTGLPLLAALFLFVGLWDLRVTSVGAPPWYRRLRILLTIAVVALLVVAALAMPGLP